MARFGGFRDAVFRIKLVGERLRNPSQALRGPIADELRRMFERIFHSNGAELGSPWAPLAQSTQYEKLVRGAGFNHILRDSDRLYKSLVDRGARGGYARVRDKSVLEFGTDIEYARYHRTGTRNMPRRDFMPTDHNFPVETQRNILEIVKQHLTLGEDD